MSPTGGFELKELELLASVAETGSLGRAAARHGLTQPAVSMRMTGLERALGLRLLRRDPSGTRLTDAGEEVVASARRVLAAAGNLAAIATRLREQDAAHLRIAASFTVAEHLVPAWIGVMRTRAPEVALTVEVLNSAQVLAAVQRQGVDIGFVEGTERDVPGLAAETIAGDELVVVVSPRHPWATLGRPLAAEELARTELVVREKGSGTREVLDEALGAWGGIRSRLELGSSAALLAAARGGEGPAVLSRLAASDDLVTGRLCAVQVAGVDLSRTLRAVWPRAVGLGTLAQHLLKTARGTLP